MLNKVLKKFTDYLKYQGVYVDDNDAGKLIDTYMRILINVTHGVDIETGLNIAFDGSMNIDLTNVDMNGINNLNAYINNVATEVANNKFNEATLTSIFTGTNVVKVLTACHLFMNIITGIIDQSMTFDEIDGKFISVRIKTLRFYSEDGTYITISGWREQKDGGKIISKYGLVSNSIISQIYDETIDLTI